jgi:hypothetical protein
MWCMNLLRIMHKLCHLWHLLRQPAGRERLPGPPVGQRFIAVRISSVSRPWSVGLRYTFS